MFGEDSVSSKDGSVLCITVDGKTANISLDTRVCTAKHSLLCVLYLAEVSLPSSIQICWEYHVPIAMEIILYLISKQLKPVHFPLFPLTFPSVDQYSACLREILTQPVSWAHWYIQSFLHQKKARNVYVSNAVNLEETPVFVSSSLLYKV